MTTAERYRIHEAEPTTTAPTPDLLGVITPTQTVAETFWLVAQTTAAQEHRRQLRRELATRSLSSDPGFDREVLLSAEIDRAWGFSGE